MCMTLATVRSLYLSKTNIDDPGVVALTQALKSATSELRTLRIGANMTGDVGVQALADALTG